MPATNSSSTGDTEAPDATRGTHSRWCRSSVHPHSFYRRDVSFLQGADDIELAPSDVFIMEKITVGRSSNLS